jgi:MFS family permease
MFLPKLKYLYGGIYSNTLFRRFVLGQSLSMIGDAVCLTALPLALLFSGYDAMTFGFVMASVGFGTILGAAMGGPWTEKMSARNILVITDSIRGGCQFIAAASIAAGAEWWCLVLIYTWFGVGIGASRPAAHLMLVNLMPKEHLIKANSLLAFLDNLIAVLFPATVGVIIILTNPVLGVFIDGATFAGAAFFTALIPAAPVFFDPKENERSPGRFHGLIIIFCIPQLNLGMNATLVINVLCFPIFLVLAPYVVAETFSEFVWGLCLAASGAGACLGAILAVSMSLHQKLLQLCVAATIFIPLAMYIIASSETLAWVVIGSGLVGLVEGTWLTVWATTMQLHSPKYGLGKVVGAETLLTSGLHPFVYLGAGLMGASIGYGTTLVAVSATSFVLLSCLVSFKYIFRRSLS